MAVFMRIYELAKKFKVTSEELIEALTKKGFAVKSHMSGATTEMAAAAEKLFAPKRAPERKAGEVKKAPVKKAKASAAPKPAAKVAARRKTTSRGGLKAPAAVETQRKAARREAGGPRRVRVSPEGRRREKAPPARKRAPGPGVAERQQKAVRESVRRTLAKLEATRRSRRRKERPKTEKAVATKLLKVAPKMPLRELATAFGVETSELLTRCSELGITAKANDRIEQDVIELLAEGLGVEIEFMSSVEEGVLKAREALEAFSLGPRAPVVTVMGHVDHGKTSILDYIRRSNVASQEAGGITQHIGAYEIETEQGSITFIDTPGHEAFTAMRARGAKVTDIVVLVVAADDGVMPQTVEAISHARAAGVPIVVAINKIDLPNANPGRVKQQLADRDILVEDFGGEVVCQEVSAKTGEGVEKLLELILLQAELLELEARSEGPARGVVIEVKKEEGRGILCTVLVKEGRLEIGDAFVAGSECGRVRALLDHLGRNVSEVKPSEPAQVLGLNGMPSAGDEFQVVESERIAREISSKRQESLKSTEMGPAPKPTLEDLYKQIQEGEVKELKLVVKADTDGSAEALVESISKLSTEEVKVEIIHWGVGFVTESDVLLASSSNAIVIGFNVKVSPKAEELASRERVEVRHYDIIYECLSEIKDAMEGMLEPEVVEKTTGRAEVRRIFKIPRVGLVAGSMVLEGSIVRNAPARVLRDGEVVHEGSIASLKRFQEDVREVQKDFECGIGVSGLTDLQEGDIIETYVVEQKSKLAT